MGLTQKPKTERATIPTKEARELPLLRAVWYRDGFRKLMQISFFIGIALVGSLTLNIVQFVTRPVPPAYGLTPDLRAVELQPISEELPPESVREWTSRALVQAFSFDFANYRRQMNEMESLFTPDGYKGYLESLERSKIRDYVKSENYVVTGIVTDVPAIVRKGVSDGRFTWVLRVPLIVKYQAGGSEIQQNLLATVIAVRVPRTESPSGIAINNILSKRR